MEDEEEAVWTRKCEVGRGRTPDDEVPLCLGGGNEGILWYLSLSNLLDGEAWTVMTVAFRAEI